MKISNAVFIVVLAIFVIIGIWSAGYYAGQSQVEYGGAKGRDDPVLLTSKAADFCGICFTGRGK